MFGVVLGVGYLAYKRQDIKFFGIAQGWKVTDYKYIGSFKSGGEYELCYKIFKENGIIFRDGKSGGPGIAFWVLNEHYDRASSLIPQVGYISSAELPTSSVTIKNVVIFSVIGVIFIFMSALVICFTQWK